MPHTNTSELCKGLFFLAFPAVTASGGRLGRQRLHNTLTAYRILVFASRLRQKDANVRLAGLSNNIFRAILIISRGELSDPQQKSKSQKVAHVLRVASGLSPLYVCVRVTQFA